MKKKSLNAKKKTLKKISKFLSNKFISKIYNQFEKNLYQTKSSLVAISGGPDSLALAFLANCYSIKNNVKFIYITVDHKLRKNSSLEAKKTINILKKFNINCKILVWKGRKPKSNIQALARYNRYSLILKECEKHKINTILLGHQMDDLKENFFLRMTRGSGLKGLVSLGEYSEVYNVKLLRPLINIEKKELIKLSLNVFNTYVDDPSNQKDLYARVRIRKFISQLEKDGLDISKINLTINNLKSANKALDYFSNKNINENSTYNKNRNFALLSKDFFLNPDEIVLRSIIVILKKINNKFYPPRGKKIKNLIIKNFGKNSLKKVTLGGCIFEKVGETLIISKE